MNNQKMVDAIEDGKIVHVPELYAKQEGLLILRKTGDSDNSSGPIALANSQIGKSWKKQDLSQLEKFRKPIKSDKNQITESLIDNFHWRIKEERQRKKLTRKQLSESINIKENDLKLVENGVLPSQDYVIVSKLEDYFGISLRKSGANYNNPLRPISSTPPSPSYSIRSLSKQKKEEKKSDAHQSQTEHILGEDIELLDDDS